MTLKQFISLAGVALLVMIANVLVSVLYMVVYGHLIDPGHDQQYYDAHIQMAAPYCSIVAGMPLMYLAGRWVSGWWQQALGYRPAWTVWVIYAVVDLAIVTASGMIAQIGLVFLVSFVTKLAAVLLGAKHRLTGASAPGLSPP